MIVHLSDQQRLSEHLLVHLQRLRFNQKERTVYLNNLMAAIADYIEP